MALELSIIKSGMLSLLDQNSLNFVGFGPDIVGVAARWSKAVDDYAKNVIPLAGNTAGARGAFTGQLILLNNQTANGVVVFKLGFQVYAAALVPGMLANGYAAVPPPVPIDFTPAFSAGMNGSSGAAVAEMMAEIIHAWFHTGTATQISTGVTVNWN